MFVMLTLRLAVTTHEYGVLSAVLDIRKIIVSTAAVIAISPECCISIKCLFLSID